jgi:hypothetical protein
MRLLRVRQNLVANPIADIRAAVRAALDPLSGSVPQGEIALTAGSRGINNIGLILRAAGEWLREHGARPFVVPAMGTHNGGTAEGQQAMLATLGVTEAAVEMPIRASMECVEIGSLRGNAVWMDRHAFDSAGVLVVNRVKLHTGFSGPVQSGLSKMMSVGLGKIGGARAFHEVRGRDLAEHLLAMRKVVLGSGKIWAGLAILEDGFDQTAELHALLGADIPEGEPKLLDRHRRYFPRLPLNEINVLVVNAIGKTYSGTGMDTNVIGYRGSRDCEDLDGPHIKIIAALSLAESSQGNAVGVGLADFITRRLRDSIDEQKTFLNTFTAGNMQMAKLPVALKDDEELVRMLADRFGERGWVFIPNTLHLETLYASEDSREPLAANTICRVEPQPVELTFQNGRHQLTF